MRNFITCPRGTDEFDDRIRGFVLANRINDILAKPNTKRYRTYLQHVQDGYSGEPAIDPNDQYREESREHVPETLDAYNIRNGVTVHRDRLYFHEDEDLRIAAIPDAVEQNKEKISETDIGITVHVRQTEDTYEQSVSEGVTTAMDRFSQAMMIITGLHYWLHLDYWRDPEQHRRRLFEHLVKFNPLHANDLENAMLGFLLKTRRRAAS